MVIIKEKLLQLVVSRSLQCQQVRSATDRADRSRQGRRLPLTLYEDGAWRRVSPYDRYESGQSWKKAPRGGKHAPIRATNRIV